MTTKREVLETLNECDITDMVYDLLKFAGVYDDMTDNEIDGAIDMVHDCLGISHNHDGVGKFRIEIVDVYEGEE